MHPDWWAARVKLGDVGRPRPALVRWVKRWLAPVVRVAHRPVLEGVEHLPTGPFLLVANHSGGTAASEIFSFMTCYLDKLGTERPLAGFAHPFGFHIWPASAVMRGVGAIPSTYGAAEAALAAGVPLLVFPGGDHESTRPIWQANRVDFGGRRGFLRIAHKAAVPIVPMGIRGSHYTVPILARSRWLLPYGTILPRLLGIRHMPLTVLGLAVAVALACTGLALWLKLLVIWLWLASPLTLLPWVPWKIRMRIGAPLAPDELFGAQPDAQRFTEALRRVEAAVERLVREG